MRDYRWVRRGSASIKLVNVADHRQIVAIQDEPKFAGGFGDVFSGSYIYEEKGRFELIRPVVAKKNKSPKGFGPEKEKKVSLDLLNHLEY